ncbi:GNAT family N-acetyltransferase [Sulfitobacter pseudonitzschiae]|uniref:GNAT family N-acetyltransferase n=1 Tax=Pseudosulfitobacter pseudonitzschiae TaxID=1402135 RepID=A0A9Q2NX18_9RHOB|nr:GNAT family N-acetyltransferase [Pseudosulfitobacter pseudonitzschiae]MBM2290814.1 GNAT family N-acetyltransferase [Pseudosulfitobacter pseudonitzschiae]MBM2295732.1 GNAT family N-acetyltransferase [Pseudosulfitobacter pseudonitzschiae]MBM2300644.1 GNAT family N-acetyltransferase [Pseudosulfitobacter pseudonitzschiae]MBM2310429.1 GNAT family N-acetyltransferase [Pseudosulfitobacter pseudonitzschiae]MBM2315341.1 GNAT family N-acetyltransferase [Pseudosulfitobacter pseudonitzschiae]
MKLFRPAETKPVKLETVRLQPHNSKVIVNRFSCGQPSLDRFLKNRAKKAEARLEQRVTVATLEGSPNCIGYFALQLGSDTVPNLPKDKLRHLQNHLAFPAVHLSFLAVDKPYQRQGLGRFLLMEVFERVAHISEHAGFYALTLQSVDDQSTEFYKSLGFEEYSEGGSQPKMLYPVENILALVRA